MELAEQFLRERAKREKDAKDALGEFVTNKKLISLLYEMASNM
jgi:hypothetical protein